MTTKICVVLSLTLCALATYFNRRSEAWADRCLYLAYTALYMGVWTLWR